MKTTHILVIVLIAIAISVIIGTYGDSSTYVNFAEAAQNPDKEFHVVGALQKDKEMKYDPIADANLFSFYVKDDAGEERLVTYNNPKPHDLERTEKIVLIGKCVGQNFHASQILLKCPSKYEADKVETASK